MSLPARILVVEDDADLRALLQLQLTREGYEVAVNATGAGVLDQVAAWRPQLVLLDLMLPQAHGLEILRELRRRPFSRELPVLVLTALGAEPDRIRGLDLGADDYLGKPVSARELAARIRARLRTAASAEDELAAGGLRLDLRAQRAYCEGQELALSATEFRLLAFFLRSPGQVFSRRQIVDAVWSPQHFITERAVDVAIRRLRARLALHAQARLQLKAVRGVGYRADLKEQITAAL